MSHFIILVLGNVKILRIRFLVSVLSRTLVIYCGLGSSVAFGQISMLRGKIAKD